MKIVTFIRRKWLLRGGKYPYVMHAEPEKLIPWVQKAIRKGWAVRTGPDSSGTYWWWDYDEGDWTKEVWQDSMHPEWYE